MPETKPKEVLMVTRPICLPWDEASKNFAWDLASNLGEVNFHLLTYGELPEKKANVKEHAIYSSPKLRLSFWQKIRLSWFLLTGLPKNLDVLHFLFTPNPLTTALITKLVLPWYNRGRAKKVKTIQSVATLNFDQLNSQNIRKVIFASEVVTYSDYSRDFLKKMGLEKVSRIYPGIDLGKYQPRVKDPAVLEELGLKNEDKVILYTGEYVRLGGMDAIIDSLPLVIEREPQIKLILACRIKSKADEIKRAQVKVELKKAGLTERVIFLESFPAMEKLYNVSDLFIFPVERMTGKFDLALTVIEAMASGLPVIMSNLSPLKEAVQVEDSAVLLGEISGQALAEKIMKVLADEALRERLGAKARENAKQFFDIRETARQYEAKY